MGGGDDNRDDGSVASGPLGEDPKAPSTHETADGVSSEDPKKEDGDAQTAEQAKDSGESATPEADGETDHDGKDWQCIFDPSSAHYYYYNPKTAATQWEAPANFAGYIYGGPHNNAPADVTGIADNGGESGSGSGGGEGNSTQVDLTKSDWYNPEYDQNATWAQETAVSGAQAMGSVGVYDMYGNIVPKAQPQYEDYTTYAQFNQRNGRFSATGGDVSDPRSKFSQASQEYRLLSHYVDPEQFERQMQERARMKGKNPLPAKVWKKLKEEKQKKKKIRRISKILED